MNDPSGPCQKPSTNLEIGNCFDRAFKAADLELNRYYGKLPSVLEPSQVEQLKVAQRLWIQLRDATCTAESDLYKGGSLAAPVYAACREEMTRHRIADLKTTYDWVIANSK